MLLAVFAIQRWDGAMESAFICVICVICGQSATLRRLFVLAPLRLCAFALNCDDAMYLRPSAVSPCGGATPSRS